MGAIEIGGATPVALQITFCGLLGALSVMTMVAFLAPASVTITSTRRVQLVPAGKVPMQLLHCQKSPPATMLLITRSAVPTFVTVTDLTEVVVPTNWLGPPPPLSQIGRAHV